MNRRGPKRSASEVAPPEEVQRQHRVDRAPFVPEKCGEHRDAAEDRPEDLD